MGVSDLEHVTPLFIDMHICTEQLHCTHEEFLKLPRIEKSKQRNYLLVKNMKRQKEFKDMENKGKAEADKQELLKSAPATRK